MKKFMSMLLVIAMMLSIAIPCSATTVAENSDSILTDEEIRGMCGTFVELTESKTRGTSAPTEGWNCETQGSLGFSGSASYSTLWLSKLVWGCTCYKVTITNKSSSTLYFHARGCTNDGIYEVPANSEKPSVFYFPMASASDYFCITFNAPSNFSGYVSCGCIIGG